jgi:hypothetical protein
MILVRDIKEIAAHANSGHAPSIEFLPLLPATNGSLRPPLFLLGPANADVLAALYGRTDTHAVGCYAIEHALVAPTGIAIQDGVAFCHADAFIHPRHHVVAVSDRLNTASLPVRAVAGPLAVIYGPAHETWGHWLVDFLPRLWVLHASGFALDRLKFLMPADVRAFAHELLTLCGIRPNQIVAYRHWHEMIGTDCLLMPTGLRAGNRLAPCFDVATAFWTGKLRQGASPLGARLYITRGGATGDRVLVNRGAIEHIAASRGLHIIQPGTLPIDAQVEMFGDASLVCGEYGSALHNTVFSAPGTVVCALRGNSLHPSFVQSGLATALNQEVGYLFGDSCGQEVRQRFQVDGTVFEKALGLGEGKAVLF